MADEQNIVSTVQCSTVRGSSAVQYEGAVQESGAREQSTVPYPSRGATVCTITVPVTISIPHHATHLPRTEHLTRDPIESTHPAAVPRCVLTSSQPRHRIRLPHSLTHSLVPMSSLSTPYPTLPTPPPRPTCQSAAVAIAAVTVQLLGLPPCVCWRAVCVYGGGGGVVGV